MSSIKTTQIDGDVSVGRNVAIGGKADISGSVSIGHNLKVEGWLEAPNIKGANKGIFLTVQELREAYPNPHDGWLAGVGASTPFAAYIGKGGDWVSSGGSIEVSVDYEFINLGEFSGWDVFSAKLNSADLMDQKYMGRCRAKVSGVNVEVYQFVNNFGQSDYTQVIFGNVSAGDNGQVKFTPSNFNIMHRRHKDGAWSAWQRINDHPLATSSLDGLMSADDKKALNSIDSAFKNLDGMNFLEASAYCATFDNIIEKVGGGGISFSKPTIFTFSGAGNDQGMIINLPSSSRIFTQYAFTMATINGGFSRRFIQYDLSNLTITNVGEWLPISSLIPAATTSAAGLMSADDKKKLDIYPAQFVMDFGLVDSQATGEQMAAASEVAGNRNISLIRFQVQGVSTLKTTLIMQWPNGINETAQIMCVDKAQWRRNVTGATGVKGAPTNAFQWERTAPHFIAYDKSRRMIQLKDYQQIVSREVELPLATSTQHGLMSAADKVALDNAAEKADTALRMMPFDGVFGNPTIETQGVSSYDAIIFDDIRCLFLARKNNKFYMSFIGSENYNTITSVTMKARTDRIFFRTDTKRTYIFNGTALSNLSISDEEVAKLANYPNTPLEIPLASEKSQGLMSAEDKTKLSKTKPVEEVTWTSRSHMNAYTECGEFHIKGERINANDGLPIINAASGHTIDATLTVLDSSLTNGTGENTDVCVTQILRMSNRTGGDGHIYVRTGQATTKSQLASAYSTYWGPWEKLMGMFEKNAVTSVDELDTCTTNGMYSGIFAGTNRTALGGIQFYPGDTFLMITANGYAATPFGTPQLTQILFKFPVRNAPLPTAANMYLRVAHWDADNKKWVFENFTRMATAPELAALESKTEQQEQRLSVLESVHTPSDYVEMTITNEQTQRNVLFWKIEWIDDLTIDGQPINTDGLEGKYYRTLSVGEHNVRFRVSEENRTQRGLFGWADDESAGYLSHVTRIVIPEGWTELPANCFDRRKHLEEIVLPSTIRIVGGNCFQSLPALRELIIPEGVTTINWSAINDCASLKSIRMGGNESTPLSLSYEAIRNCPALTCIEFLPCQLTFKGSTSPFQNLPNLSALICHLTTEPTFEPASPFGTIGNSASDKKLYRPAGIDFYASGYWSTQLCTTLGFTQADL